MRTAVVTGAGRGLGRLIARGLAAKGYQVLVTDIDAAAAHRTADEIGGGAWAMGQDVRDPASHLEVAAAASARAPLAVWVNNAGVLKTGSAWDIDEAEIRRHVDVNVLGVIWGSRAAVEAMRESGGHIINMASISSIVPAPGLAVYAATKHAVLGYSTSLEGDFQRAGLPIKVSAVCPNAIDTEMVRENAEDEEAALLFSSKKLLQPEDVARVVVGLIERPRLMVLLPPSRGLLAQVFQPFPALGLRMLRQFASIGDRNRRERRA